MVVKNGNSRPRNLRLEQELIDMAAKSQGLTTDGGLGMYANWRAKPGDVFIKDRSEDTRKDIADAANRILFDLEMINESYMAGDAQAADDYERLMRALSYQIASWCAYHTPSR